jgi:hypothetical protein
VFYFGDWVVCCSGGVFLEETVLEIFEEKLHGIMENRYGFMLGCGCGSIKGDEIVDVLWIHFR